MVGPGEAPRLILRTRRTFPEANVWSSTRIKPAVVPVPPAAVATFHFRSGETWSTEDSVYVVSKDSMNWSGIRVDEPPPPPGASVPVVFLLTVNDLGENDTGVNE